MPFNWYAYPGKFGDRAVRNCQKLYMCSNSLLSGQKRQHYVDKPIIFYRLLIRLVKQASLALAGYSCHHEISSFSRTSAGQTTVVLSHTGCIVIQSQEGIALGS